MVMRKPKVEGVCLNIYSTSKTDIKNAKKSLESYVESVTGETTITAKTDIISKLQDDQVGIRHSCLYWKSIHDFFSFFRLCVNRSLD